MSEAAVSSTEAVRPRSPVISFINSNKGKPLLVANNYVFKLNKTTTTTKYWICKLNGCAAKIHTNLNNQLIKTIFSTAVVCGSPYFSMVCTWP